MEAATSAPAVGYTVEQVRAQQNDRIYRRAVQNLHVQIIEVTGEHARTHARTHAREMKHVKRWRNCQRRASIGLNRSAEGPHAHLRTRQSADINLDDEEHGSLSSV